MRAIRTAAVIASLASASALAASGEFKGDWALEMRYDTGLAVVGQMTCDDAFVATCVGPVFTATWTAPVTTTCTFVSQPSGTALFSCSFAGLVVNAKGVMMDRGTRFAFVGIDAGTPVTGSATRQ